MPDLRVLCVREDVARVQSLAERLEKHGINISDNSCAAVTLIIWSDHSAASLQFLRLACDAAREGAIVVSLTPPHITQFGAAPVIDLSSWCVDDEDALTPLLDAIANASPPLSLVQFPVIAPDQSASFDVDDDDCAVPLTLSVPSARWRRLRAGHLRARRFGAAAAVAVAVIAFMGLQFGTRWGEPAAAAPPTTLAALYDPVEVAELDALPLPAMAEPQPAAPQRLLEPANAPTRSR